MRTRLGPLDQLPPFLRHLLIALAPIVLTEASTTWIPVLRDRWGATGVGSVIVTLLVLITSTLTRQYGTGSTPPAATR